MRLTMELRVINSLIGCGVLPPMEYVLRGVDPLLSAIRAPVFLSWADFLGIVNRTDQGQTRRKTGTQSLRSKAQYDDRFAMAAGLPAVRLRLLHLERTGVLGGRMVRDKYGNRMSFFLRLGVVDGRIS